MPSKKIIKPKVFISYAWGNEEYQHKVLSFATKLMGDGIEVVLDKWDLKEGMDTFSFMEESVNNPKITNVLLLLDPVYAKKADNRDGGVGTETQIISTEVYRKVKQEKFIPVIFERNKRGNVCKPKYLVSRLHFDLSIAESFDSEYMRLVKTLYGVDSYVKPEIGNEPVWVEKPLITGLKNNVSYDFLKTHQPIQKKKESFMNYLNSIFNRIADFVQYNETEITADNYIDKYDSTEAIRNDYLLLLNQSVYIVGCYTEIADFFEKTENAICGNRTEAKNIIAIRIHEMFIYTIAFYLKSKDFKNVGNLLGETYFNNNGKINACCSYVFLHCDLYRNKLDQKINKLTKKDNPCGTATHWIDTLAMDFCSKEQFIFADLICFNYSIYGKDFIGEIKWLPLLYTYDEYNNGLLPIGTKLKSKEYVLNILPMFNYSNVKEFIEKFESVAKEQNYIKDTYRFSASFTESPILGDFIDANDIATLR